MDNEGKILNMLEQLAQRFETFEQRFEALEQRFETLEQRFETLEQRFETLEQRFETFERDLTDIKVELAETKAIATEARAEATKAHVFLEAEIRPGIRLLAEGFGSMVKKLERIEPIVDSTAFDVSVIKAVVTSHSSEISKLKSAV